jgi:protein-arginine deiminase
LSFNSDAQIKLDDIRATMKAEIGVTDADIVELPVLFFEDPHFPGHASALTGGIVNMLVANGHAGVCHAFGPEVGGVDLFEDDVQTKLSSLGLTVHFIDDWYLYHLQEGEVHCGTNAMRHETIHPWWRFVP